MIYFRRTIDSFILITYLHRGTVYVHVLYLYVESIIYSTSPDICQHGSDSLPYYSFQGPRGFPGFSGKDGTPVSLQY